MIYLHRLFFLPLLCLCCITAHSQKLRYEVTLFGGKIGETTVEARDSAGCKVYTLRSTTEAKMIFVDKKSDMTTRVRFDKEGKLACSFFENKKDDETLYTKATCEKGKLIVDVGDKRSEIPGPVTASSVQLYFGEPKNLKKIFSERLGKIFELVKQNDGTYIAKVDGSSAIYTYQNNKLVQLELSKGSIGSIYLKLIQ